MGYLELAKTAGTEGRRVDNQATPPHPVSPETLEGIFQETLNDLNRRCVQGLLGEADPSRLNQVNETQARVDKTWREALAGKATLENFRQAVAQWHGAVINLFTTDQKASPGRLS